MMKQKVYTLMMSRYDICSTDDEPLQVSLKRVYTSKEKAQAVCDRLQRETNLYKQRECDKYAWVETHPERKDIKKKMSELDLKHIDYYNLNKDTNYTIEMSLLRDSYNKKCNELNKRWELDNKLPYELTKLKQKYYVEEITLILNTDN